MAMNIQNPVRGVQAANPLVAIYQARNTPPAPVALARDSRASAGTQTLAGAAEQLAAQGRRFAGEIDRKQQQLAKASPEEAAMLMRGLGQLRDMVARIQTAERMVRTAAAQPVADPAQLARVIDLAKEIGRATPEEGALLMTRLSSSLSHLQGAETVPALDAARESLAVRLGELNTAMRQVGDELARANPVQYLRCQAELGALNYLHETTQTALTDLEGFQREIQRQGLPSDPERQAALARAQQLAGELVRSSPAEAGALRLQIGEALDAFAGRRQDPGLAASLKLLAEREAEAVQFLRTKAEEARRVMDPPPAKPGQTLWVADPELVVEHIGREQAGLRQIVERTTHASGQLTALAHHVARAGGDPALLQEAGRVAEALSRATPGQAYALQAQLDKLDNQLRGGTPNADMGAARQAVAERASELFDALRRAEDVPRPRMTQQEGARNLAEVGQLRYLMGRTDAAFELTGRIEALLRGKGPDAGPLATETLALAKRVASARPEEIQPLVEALARIEKALGG